LATKIESKLENVPEEQKTLISRTAAVEIVEKLAKPEVVIETQVQTAILRAVSEDKTGVLPKVLNQDDNLLLTAKRGSTLLELENRNSEYLSKNIAKNIFGSKLTASIYGTEQIQIILSETKIEGQTTHQINLGDLNQNQIQVLNHQNELLNSAQQFGVNKIEGFFTNQSRVYLAEKIAKLPAGSVVKKTYSSPITQTILARYGLAQPVVWETVGQTGFVKLAMQIAPDTAGPMLSLAGKALGKEFVKPVVGKVATQIAVKTGFGATITTALSSLGAAAGPVGLAITTAIVAAITAVGKMINWPKIKQWFIDNKEVFVGLGAGAGLLIGGPVAGLVTGGLLMAATGTLGAFAMGAFGVFGFIGRSIGIAIATPVIITLLVLPPLVAFIMLVINNSAYVVPPFSSSSLTGADNPYLLVTKTAEPNKISNPTSKTTVTYTVSIKALKAALTNIKLVSTECTVTSKTKTAVCPPENIPELPADLSISPTNPYAFTFTVNYSSFYADSLVYDSIEISADSTEKTGITTSGSATLCIGDCPTDCAKVSDNAQKWPSNLKSNSENALGKLSSKYQGFMAKVCAKNEEINLCYNPPQISPGYFAWHIHNAQGNKCDIYFNEKGLKSDKDALFLITHELTHHIQNINSGSVEQYDNTGAWSEISSRGFCTYSDTKGSITESMAEANGLYASVPSWGSCASNYKNLYPKNYMFAKKFME